MKLTRILCVICTLWSTMVVASPLQQKLDQLITNNKSNINIGVSIVDLTTDKFLYQHNEQKLFTPASNMKLFSDAAGLLFLGADFRFKNRLSTNAKIIDNGKLKGSVYLYLSGDPSFSRVDLKSLLSALKEYGVHAIDGDIIIVSNNKNISPYAHDWLKDDLKYDYGAPLAPVILDENRINLIVNPASQLDKLAAVELKPEYSNITPNNLIKTTKNTSCIVNFDMDNKNLLSLNGCVQLGQASLKKRIAIKNSLLYMQSIINQQLSDLNIKLTGKIITGKAAENSVLISTRSSKPLKELISDTLKPSDNLYADSIFLQTAALINGSAVDWPKAQTIIKEFLQEKTGINLKNAILTDGSGLSRSNLVSPSQTTKLLIYLYHQFPLAYEYISALPIAGIDGTLKSRFKNQKGFIRAKTGTMKGIVSLSGYLYTANERTLAFAIYINTKDTKRDLLAKERALIDEICNLLLQQSINFTSENTALTRQDFNNKKSNIAKIPNTLTENLKWRHLEHQLKKTLQGQPVTILYHDDHLVILDENRDVNKIWKILQKPDITDKLAIALEGQYAPIVDNNSAFLLWINKNPVEKLNENNKRIWTLRQKI